MQRYALFIKFNGLNYHGWQIQENAITIQSEIQDALSVILPNKIEVVGAGRTDAGVHATMMVAHFDAPPIEDLRLFCHKINGILKSDIALQDIREAVADFHARFDALSRTYHYQVYFDKDPFLKDFCHQLIKRPDIGLMNEAAKKLIGKKDFSCFSKSNTQTHTNICEVHSAEWKNNGEVWVFEIKADRFLRNMVRAIVGTLLEIGDQRREVNDIDDLLLSKDRSNAGVSVPAHGLFLSHIDYPESRFI